MPIKVDADYDAFPWPLGRKVTDQRGPVDRARPESGRDRPRRPPNFTRQSLHPTSGSAGSSATCGASALSTLLMQDHCDELSKMRRSLHLGFTRVEGLKQWRCV